MTNRTQIEAALKYADLIGPITTNEPYQHLIVLADGLRNAEARETRLRGALETILRMVEEALTKAGG